MKIDFKLNITTLLIIIVGVILFFMWNGQRKEANRWESNYNNVIEQFASYKIKADGSIAIYKASIELTEKELMDALRSDSVSKEIAKYYKELSEVVEIKTEFITKWDTLEVLVPIYIDRDTLIHFSDACLSFDLGFSNGLASFSGLSIQNDFRFVSGERKLGLFKGTEYSVDVRNSNPCITTTDVTSYRVIHKDRIYENPLLYGVAGFAVGFILGGR